jgi:hypothetical protein
MVVGDNMFGVVSYIIVERSENCRFFTPRTAFRAFSETELWIYV